MSFPASRKRRTGLLVRSRSNPPVSDPKTQAEYIDLPAPSSHVVQPFVEFGNRSIKGIRRLSFGIQPYSDPTAKTMHELSPIDAAKIGSFVSAPVSCSSSSPAFIGLDGPISAVNVSPHPHLWPSCVRSGGTNCCAGCLLRFFTRMTRLPVHLCGEQTLGHGRFDGRSFDDGLWDLEAG
ncbi:hypothetical protein BJ508DRAFT_16463 [Ascobolus immersus RN42]|uniref:Uncharacterized protein n=1 Tax=Ascobolus immersus RN42 TaxID=1160509 RepID=A0A3N4HVC8_ASCIM|nr:hypothetical protein BJ508DRAFT_16463 [Ascobolus immersus RN42]